MKLNDNYGKPTIEAFEKAQAFWADVGRKIEAARKAREAAANREE